jgi:predicted RecB family nuclease
LENPEVVEEWLGFRPQVTVSKEASYDRLADWFEESADRRVLANLLKNERTATAGERQGRRVLESGRLE